MTEPSTSIQTPDSPAHNRALGRLLWPKIELLVHAHNPRQAEAVANWIGEGRDCAFVAGRIAKAMRGSSVYFERARKLYEDRTGLRLHALGRADWKRAVLRTAIERGDFALLDRLLWDTPDTSTIWVRRDQLAGSVSRDFARSGQPDDRLLLHFDESGTAAVARQVDARALSAIVGLYWDALLQGDATATPPLPHASITVADFTIPRPELWASVRLRA